MCFHLLCGGWRLAPDVLHGQRSPLCHSPRSAVRAHLVLGRCETLTCAAPHNTAPLSARLLGRKPRCFPVPDSCLSHWLGNLLPSTSTIDSSLPGCLWYTPSDMWETSLPLAQYTHSRRKSYPSWHFPSRHTHSLPAYPEKECTSVSSRGLSWWLSGKESTGNAGDTGPVPRVGRSPERGHGDPLQYSCMDRGAQRVSKRRFQWLSDLACRHLIF